MSEAEVQFSIPSDKDISLDNVDELLRSVTKDIQDQLIQEEKSQENATQTDEKTVVVEVIPPVQEPTVQS